MNVQKVITHATTADDAAPSGSVGFGLSNVVTANHAELASGVEVDFQPTSGQVPIVGGTPAVTLQLYLQNADDSWSTSGPSVTVNGGDVVRLPFRASSKPLNAYVRATGATGCDGYVLRIGETVRFDRYVDTQDAATLTTAKAYTDAQGSTSAKNASVWTLISTTLALGTAQPLLLTDASMTGKVAGGSVAGAGVVGVVAASFSSSGNETGTTSGKGGLGSAANASQPLNSTDFPGQNQIHVELRKQDGDDVLLSDMLSTATGADIEAKVYGYVDFRSDAAADNKWRVWFYYRRASDGLETPFTPDTAVTNANLFVPEVMSVANLPVGAGIGIPIAAQAAAKVVPGVVGDITAATVAAAAAGASGRFADAAHQHAMTTAAPTALSADAPAAGAAASLSRSDHDHGVQGLLRCIEFAVAHAATVDSTTALTTNAHVYKCRFKVTTPYSANATLDVGQAGHTTDFVNHGAAGADPALSDLSLLATGDIIDVDGITTVAAAAAIRASIGGSPAAGAGTLMVWFAEPLS